jgi:hypothetical protein
MLHKCTGILAVAAGGACTYLWASNGLGIHATVVLHGHTDT